MTGFAVFCFVLVCIQVAQSHSSIKSSLLAKQESEISERDHMIYTGYIVATTFGLIVAFCYMTAWLLEN